MVSALIHAAPWKDGALLLRALPIMPVLLQAMGLMLPRCQDSTNQAKSSLEGKLDCMSLNGYGYTARENVDLNRYVACHLSVS